MQKKSLVSFPSICTIPALFDGQGNLVLLVSRNIGVLCRYQFVTIASRTLKIGHYELTCLLCTNCLKNVIEFSHCELVHLKYFFFLHNVNFNLLSHRKDSMTKKIKTCSLRSLVSSVTGAPSHLFGKCSLIFFRKVSTILYPDKSNEVFHSQSFRLLASKKTISPFQHAAGFPGPVIFSEELKTS